MTGYLLWMMLVLGLMMVIAVYIFIERYIVINNAIRADRQFITKIRDLPGTDKMDSVSSLCKNSDSPSARMMEKGIKRTGMPLSDINISIENAGNLEVARLEKNIAAIATVAGAAPLLGFLGTIASLVMSFYDLSISGNNINTVLLSKGIYHALISTIFGLAVGILSYILFSIIVFRIEKLVRILDLRTSEFLDLMVEKKK